MTPVSLRRPIHSETAFSQELEATASFQVSRKDITFANVSPECVHIEITVHNVSEERSAPTIAHLMAAPLGAFVPPKPLTVLPVPAIEAGESAVLTVDALRPETAPLGPPDRVRPRQLLTALGGADNRPRAPSTRGTGTGLLRGLPPDLLELLGNGNVHWAGNLNIFIGDQSVERHLAQALRIYPDRLNTAMFVLGTGHDAYRFHLIGEGTDWDARLFDMTDGQTLHLDVSRFPPVVEDQWLEAPTTRVMMLALRPPQSCQGGSVEVHVTQRSTDATAVVEFSLDPNAAGPGCFVV
jgi:hypothetical protein